jgi:hypothetical protein
VAENGAKKSLGYSTRMEVDPHASGLLGCTFTFRIIGNDAGEIDGIAVDHRLAHTRSSLVTFDLHRCSFPAINFTSLI